MNVPPASMFLAVGLEAEGPDLLDTFSFQSAGLAVVLLSLGSLAVIVSILGRVLRSRPVPESRMPPSAEEGLSPETIAIIAAAVDSALETPHRIVRIESSATSAWVQAWSVEGRRQIFQSHRIR